jgi:tetratricopeptide (TPR) repeat protein
MCDRAVEFPITGDLDAGMPARHRVSVPACRTPPAEGALAPANSGYGPRAGTLAALGSGSAGCGRSTMAKIRQQRSSKSSREKRAARAKAARVARRRVGAEHEAQRRLDELFAEETPVARSAALMIERLGDGPVPAGIARVLAVAGSEERARAVAAEVERLAPQTPTALTLAADVTFQLDDDARSASALLDRALATVEDVDGRIALAAHLLELGRAAEALAILEALLPDCPEDEDAQALRADALELAYRRIHPPADAECLAAPDACPCWSGRAWSECCRAAEERALERFDDRERLYGLRAAMVRFTATEPAVGAPVEDHVARWLEDAGAESRDESEREGLVRLAAEHAWLVGEEEDAEEEEASGGFDRDAPLALFAADARTSAEDALAARRWLSHCHYGLWQVADATSAPGVWLVDIVTGLRRYAAIPPEQLEQASRWTVLLGALVAIDGTWRTAGAVLPLRPSEADAAADLVEEMAYAIVSAMSGRRIERDRPERRARQPFGVLAARAEPAEPEVADLMGKVLGSGMPQLVGMVHEMRDAAPRLVNRELGEEPTVSGKLVIDPAQDLPQLRSGSMLPFTGSEEANTAWLAHWPDQKLPALGGRTPRHASHRVADQPRLEALLRELEHDAELLARHGLPALDVSRLRTELQMPADAWL